MPLAYVNVLGWVRITAPHAEARAACLSVTAYIHLMHPQLPLRDLDAQAETAIKELEDGALSVTVIDHLHRVDRAAGTHERQGPPLTGRQRPVPPFLRDRDWGL